eukprot:Pompholyxophrys_punicea_v1_NODE_414_length_2023_cov_2.321138.p3 type:complete len:100 gc:universal NODE_414_length_2023_cov_2.321138:1226-1525(+)
MYFDSASRLQANFCEQTLSRTSTTPFSLLPYFSYLHFLRCNCTNRHKITDSAPKIDETRPVFLNFLKFFFLPQNKRHYILKDIEQELFRSFQFHATNTH